MNWFIDFLDDVQHDLRRDVKRMNLRRRTNKFLDFLDDVQHDVKHDVKHMNLRRKADKVKRNVQNVSLHRDTFSTGNFLYGAIAGAFLGIIVAAFVLPKSGRETRAYLSEKSREVKDKAVGTLETASDKAGRLVEQGRDRVESTLKRGQKQYDVAKSQGRDFAYETRERVSDTLDRAADEVDPGPRI
jgi:gas vesicle protein